MDYMQEVGRRQQKALTALLLGGGEAQTEMPSAAESAERAAIHEHTASAKRTDAQTGAEAAERPAQAEMPETEAAEVNAASQMRAEEMRLLRPAEPDENSGGAAGTERQSRLEHQAEMYRLSRSADAVWRGEPTERSAPPNRVFRISEAADSWDAAAMSRIFQRDARRYDGSFRTD